MIIALLFLSITSLCSIVGLYYSVKKNIQLIEELEVINSQLDSSIEELDYLHKKIDKKSKVELFSDEPMIRELVEDIKQAKKIVMSISESFTVEKENNTKSL
jgi:hypothetical protein